MQPRFELRRLASCWMCLVSMCLAVVPLLACGGSGGESASGTFKKDTTCGAAISVYGAVALRVAPSDSSTACVSQTSVDTDISATFVFLDSELSNVDLQIDGVKEGETGSGFHTRVTIEHDDGRKWQAPHCTAEITEHEDIGPAELGRERYRVAGSVECDAAPSMPEGAGAALDVESLAFVVSIAWD